MHGSAIEGGCHFAKFRYNGGVRMTTGTVPHAASHAGRAQPIARLLEKALRIQAPPAHRDLRIDRVCLDSREVAPGSLFVAVAGTARDGATFVADAISRGAVAIVSERDLSLPSGVAHIRVDDARTAAAKLAASFFGLDCIQTAGGLRVIGITGTNGKTTTAYLLRSILRSADHPTAMLGTVEYDLIDETIPAALTTPDAVTLVGHLVRAAEAGARYAVMEVSSHSLDQHRTAGIRFAAGVFTNLTQDHLDYHKTLEAYFLAKRRLFEGLADDAAAVLNADDPRAGQIARHTPARIIRYGLGDSADVAAVIRSESSDGALLRLRTAAEDADIELPLVGRHNVYNALAAASTALALGLTMNAVTTGLRRLRAAPGRLQRVDTDRLGFSVLVDYAHTDDALRNALAALRPLTRGKLVCVFGCGGDRDKTKRPLMARAVAEAADRFIITSDNPRTEDPLSIIADIKAGLSAADLGRHVTEPDRAKAIRLAISELAPGDTLLIAGKGHEKYQILGTRRIHFDDVEVAQEIVDEMSGRSARANPAA